MKIIVLIIAGVVFSLTSCAQKKETNHMKDEYQVNKSDSAWKAELKPMEYYVLREKGTERPFTGKYDKHSEKGTYYCAACGTALFESETKFDSGCGWPSFWNPKLQDNVKIQIDKSHGMVRDEVLCSHCGGHLGHVFNDGPEPTGLRYCINSAALDFKPEESKKKESD